MNTEAWRSVAGACSPGPRGRVLEIGAGTGLNLFKGVTVFESDRDIAKVESNGKPIVIKVPGKTKPGDIEAKR